MTHMAFGTVAPTSRRAVAYIIDAAIAAGIGIVLSVVLGIASAIAGPDGMLTVLAIGGPIAWLVLIGWLVFYTYMQTRGGSIGMRAQGLRLVQESDGSPLSFGRALLRNVIFGLAASIIVGYFTPLFDGSGRFQGWHDKVARSLMLDARSGHSSAAAPATQAMSIPPQPVAPNAVPPLPGHGGHAPMFPQTGSASGSMPPVPGLTPARPTPGYSSPESIAYAALVGPGDAPADSAPDETIPAPPGMRVQPSIPTAAPQLPVAHPPAPAPADGSLIAFVPGITQDGPPSRSTPQPEMPAAPAAPVAPASPTAPAVPAEPVAPAAPAAPLMPPAPAIPTAAAPAPSAPDTAPQAVAAQPAAPAAEATEQPAAAEGLGDVEDTRISIPGHRLVFTWDDGTKVTVSQRTLFGRNPAPEEGAVAVIVRDETLSLSKTHFEAAAEASGGWIKDRHSTNGTAIVRDGERIPCTPGEEMRIRLGDAIEIGDRIVTVGGYA